MEPKSSMNTNTVMAVITAGLIALLLGASASVNLGEFVVPSLQMDDVTLSVVDDVTSTETELPYAVESSDDGFMASLRSALGFAAKDAHADRQAQYLEHLDERLASLENMTAVLEFCLNDANCTVDDALLVEMIAMGDNRTAHLEDAIANGTVPTKAHHTHKHHDDDDDGFFHWGDDDDDDDDDHDESYHLTDSNSTDNSTDNTTVDNRTVELTAHLDRLNATKAALEHCQASVDCDVDATFLEAALLKVDERIVDLTACLEDGACTSLKDHNDKDHDDSPYHRARHGGKGHHDDDHDDD